MFEVATRDTRFELQEKVESAEMIEECAEDGVINRKGRDTLQSETLIRSDIRPVNALSERP